MKVSCNLHVAFTCSLSSHKVIANLHCIGKKQSKQSYCSFQVEIWTLSYNNNYFCLDSFDTCNCIFTFVNFTSYNQINGVFYQMHNISFNHTWPAKYVLNSGDCALSRIEPGRARLIVK